MKNNLDIYDVGAPIQQETDNFPVAVLTRQTDRVASDRSRVGAPPSRHPEGDLIIRPLLEYINSAEIFYVVRDAPRDL